jgi:hypothetical protein
VSRSYVNKILQGSTNFTIETPVKIGIAPEAEFRFEFVEEGPKEDIPGAKAADILELSSVS